MLNYSILLKKISRLNDISTIRDIINSVNDNQIKNKLWLIEKLNPYLNMYTSPKMSIAAGWHGLLAHLLNDKENIHSFDVDDSKLYLYVKNKSNNKTSIIIYNLKNNKEIGNIIIKDK